MTKGAGTKGAGAEIIRIAAAAIADRDGRVLLVRKQGTQAFMQPGGKLEVGEAPQSCLARELGEELGVEVDERAMVRLGVFSAPAANESDATVEAVVFAVTLHGDVAAKAEIAEIAWIDPRRPGGIALAPLTRDRILPLLLERL